MIGGVEPLTEDAVRGSFVNCSKGQARRLSLPEGWAAVDWAELDFLAWRDPKAVQNGYLVVPREDRPLGVALQVATPPRGRIKQSMCAFCQTTHGQADVALFSARRVGEAGKLGNTVGTYLCADLACCRHVRNKTPRPGAPLTQEERVERLLANLNGFLSEVLTDNAR
jgi:hypothetical protein